MARALATDPAARGLMDDAAVLELGDKTLVLSHDMIVEGAHYLSSDPPGDVAWKLVAVNLSDLAGKGARPLGVLLGFTLGDESWDRGFVKGLRTALTAFGIPLLGGDTVSAPSRVLGLTAIGVAAGPVPSRAGASPGDHLWVSGTIGDAGAGLHLLRSGKHEPAGPIVRYRLPRPRLEAGERLAALVTAMMDVSDGLLLDSRRIAAASGCRIEIELETVPLSADWLALNGDGLEARLAAATAGDDYELLFAARLEAAPDILRLGDEIGLPFSRVGRFEAGAGLFLTYRGREVPRPERLGFEHEGESA